MKVLSLGGGTQSCALALMSAAGDLPKLDHIIFADTQGELPETCGSSRRAKTQSTVRRSRASMKQSEDCRCGHKRIGMTRKGEKVRVHTPTCSKCDCAKFDPWQVNRWPLIELRMKRHDTIRWFADHGHPTPPRSACWFCPNSGNDRWQQLRADHPGLFERAAVLDETIRNGGGFNARGNVPFAGKLYLHKTLIPLREADLRTDRQVLRDSGQGELFDDDVLASDCTAGVCFT